MAELPPAIEGRLRELPQGLRDHIERSRDVGRELAERFGVDAAKVDLAVAAHDLARAMRPDGLLSEAGRLGLDVHPVEERHPVLLHGAVAAHWLAHEIGLTDPDVLEAVRWHTTGRRGMGEIAKV
ncbi:MAG: HD domain-containing protein, partial [Chloroflexi bacterium]|nr:HD domain-containing protein [Chloroflexota bacterium]